MCSNPNEHQRRLRHTSTKLQSISLGLSSCKLPTGRMCSLRRLDFHGRDLLGLLRLEPPCVEITPSLGRAKGTWTQFQEWKISREKVLFSFKKKTQKKPTDLFFVGVFMFSPIWRGMQRYVASFKVEGMFHLWTNTHPPFWRMTVMEWSHLRWLRSEEISHFPWWIIDAFLLLRCHAKLSKQSALIRFFLWAQLASGFC